MSVAPVQRPGATRKNAMPVPRLERPPGRRREGPAGVIELVLELALAGDAADRRVAGVALDGLGGTVPPPSSSPAGAPLVPASVSTLARIVSCGRGPAPSRLPPEPCRPSSTRASALRWP